MVWETAYAVSSSVVTFHHSGMLYMDAGRGHLCVNRNELYTWMTVIYIPRARVWRMVHPLWLRVIDTLLWSFRATFYLTHDSKICSVSVFSAALRYTAWTYVVIALRELSIEVDRSRRAGRIIQWAWGGRRRRRDVCPNRTDGPLKCQLTSVVNLGSLPKPGDDDPAKRRFAVVWTPKIHCLVSRSPRSNHYDSW